MPNEHATDELPILRAYYDFVLWLMPKMGMSSRRDMNSLYTKGTE